MPARLAPGAALDGEAAQLQPTKSQYPFTEANTHLARAIGAARSGDAESAKRDLKEIEARRDALKAANNGYWATEVEVMRLSASGWVALAENRSDEALSLMRQAADTEDRNEKHPVTPGRLLPAREQLGDMLMELKRPKEALAEYELSMQREPNRFRGYYGAALAAEMAGDGKSARKYYTRLVQVAGKGDGRAELTLARNYLAQ
jgi:tetratricopeptide (TPR) repeat protein